MDGKPAVSQGNMVTWLLVLIDPNQYPLHMVKKEGGVQELILYKCPEAKALLCQVRVSYSIGIVLDDYRMYYIIRVILKGMCTLKTTSENKRTSEMKTTTKMKTSWG